VPGSAVYPVRWPLPWICFHCSVVVSYDMGREHMQVFHDYPPKGAVEKSASEQAGKPGEANLEERVIEQERNRR
jgi:hypothetical protein